MHERTLGAADVLFHYVRDGPAAIPLTDKNGDGTPDFAAVVVSAAEHALSTYRTLGYPTPSPDSDGPDGRIDIYADAIAFLYGNWGVSMHEPAALGGSFILLDCEITTTGGGTDANIAHTVAHELFHLVQYEAPTFSSLPRTIVEGTADMAADQAEPQPGSLYLRGQNFDWLFHSWLSLDTNTPYGSELLWQYLADRDPGFWPAFYALPAQTDPARLSSDLSLAPLLAARGDGSFDSLYTGFALQVCLAQPLPSRDFLFVRNKPLQIGVTRYSLSSFMLLLQGRTRLTVRLVNPRQHWPLLYLVNRNTHKAMQLRPGGSGAISTIPAASADHSARLLIVGLSETTRVQLSLTTAP